jgi:hypothetical protein
MSAIRPTATKLLRGAELPLSANSEHAPLRVAAIVLSSQTLDRKTSTRTLPKTAEQSDYERNRPAWG